MADSHPAPNTPPRWRSRPETPGDSPTTRELRIRAEKKWSIRKTVEHCNDQGIPVTKSSLGRRSLTSVKKSPGRKPVLSKADIEDLVDLIKVTTEAGFPPSRAEAATLVGVRQKFPANFFFNFQTLTLRSSLPSAMALTSVTLLRIL